MPAISAFDELNDHGHLGPECLFLINRLISEEVRRLPVLSPLAAQQVLEDILGDFLVYRLKGGIANCLALATDENSVGRLPRKSIRNWLIDKARKTAVGSLRCSLELCWAASDVFETVPAGEEGAGR
ncbi:hypothetical protein [Streptomyces sp. NBC_00829]|uniref:hypothetical protein n=1 Tax=Streptomyces sp. NBC_00829 TaxID=2903679 RepID=UPI00386EF032|nr:hypothetical protein OG293_33335 [Streptomyces sp. NBC_00829]